MTREKFKENLIDALEYRDQWVDDETLEEFIKLNYENVKDWNHSDFRTFVSDICAEDFNEACHLNDLKRPFAEEED